MRGSVTDLVKDRDYGSILGEDGRIIYFDKKAFVDSGSSAVAIGDWVEYQEQRWGGRTHAVMVKRIPGRRIAAASRL
jgi:hypothetical protein